MTLRLALSLVAALLVGCTAADDAANTDDAPDATDDTGPGQDDAPAPIAYDDLYGAMAEAYCVRVFACCDDRERRLGTIIPYADSRPDLPTVEACITYMTAELERSSLLQFLAGPVSDERVRYDEARAAECVAQYAAMSCEDFARERPLRVRDMRSCSPFVGTRATGDVCEYDQQCVTGYCVFAKPGSDKTCEPLPTNGETCSSGRCADGLFCHFAANVCEPALSLGDECTYDAACTSGLCSFDLSEDARTGYCSVADGRLLCDGQ